MFHLFRVRETSIYDEIVNSFQSRHWLTKVSNAEYDQALSRTPNICRPFSCAMGDCRNASACLSTAAFDYRLARQEEFGGAGGVFAAMARSYEGLHKLSMLADAVADRLRL
jgi:hypothetical protein